MKKQPLPEPPPSRKVKNAPEPPKNDFSNYRIAEWNGKVFIEKRIGLGWIIGRKIWVRMNEHGGFDRPAAHSPRLPVRPDTPDKEFKSVQQARDWLRKPKPTLRPRYYEI